MLNEVHVHGIVVKNDEFRGTRLLRVAVPHDPGRPGVGDDTAYITLRVEPPLALVAATLSNGARVRASGYLIHRDYPLTLARFAEAATSEDGNDDPEMVEILEQLKSLARRAGTRIFKPHSTTEVVVERLIVE